MSDVVDRLSAALSGRYVLERELGAGGMATVYLAQDLKHHRKVALKVLRPELAAVVGAERFLAEIETTANLQHPHILPLYDSGEADSFLFYVMPYVEGETLRDRLDREKQLPVDEAVRIATAVAGALDYAHRHGVVHRDVKPGNILMQDGQPVVGDFGIALALGAAGGRLTETGLSVGTPYYMSPEQATGDQAVGPPSDIFALGAVLYELLTGEPPYMGKTAQAVLGRIIQGAPVSATGVRPAVPANVDAAIRKALEALPADRFTTAQDFARALSDPGFRHGVGVGAGTGRSPWKRLFLGMTGLAAALALLAAWAWLRPAALAPAHVARFVLSTTGTQSGPVPNEWLTLSGDGTEMVMSYPDSAGKWRLWLRRPADLRATPVAGAAEGPADVPSDPMLSPDGTEVAYFGNGNGLYVAPVAGGMVRTLAADGYCCGRWGDDGFIYFTTSAGNIQRVPAGGGAVEDVVVQDSAHVGGMTYFQILPGGDAGVYTVSGTHIEAIRLSTGQRTMLTPGFRSYVTPTGHLVFATPDGRILAAPFDTRALRLTGAPVTVAEGVGMNNNEAMYTLSGNGTLLYWRTGARSSRAEFVWLDRDGHLAPADSGLSFDPGSGNFGWSLAPDGRRVAYRDVGAGGEGHIWIEDLDRGTRSRLTFNNADDWSPRWNAAGDTVFFVSDRDGKGRVSVWAKRADGVGEARRVVAVGRPVADIDLSGDGGWLLVRVGGQGSRDILAARPGVDSAAMPLLASPHYDEVTPALSPDGRWLAYVSSETSPYLVYVRPFPDVNAGRWQISSEASMAPRWSPDGTELFFSTLQGFMATRVDTRSGFRILETRRLVPGGVIQPLLNELNMNGWYDVAPDGKRFLVARHATEQSGGVQPELVLVQNFYDELRGQVGGR